MKTTIKKKKNQKRQAPQVDLKKKSQRIRNDKLIQALFVISLIVLIWEINIFRKTFIAASPLVLTMFIIALITTPLTFRFLIRNDTDLDSMNWQILFKKSIWRISKAYLIIIPCCFLVNWIVFGGLSISGFMLSNYYLADNKCTEIPVEIIKISELNGRYRETYVEVIMPDNSRKELFPPKSIYKNWEIGSHQTISIKKGRWGYDVVQW